MKTKQEWDDMLMDVIHSDRTPPFYTTEQTCYEDLCYLLSKLVGKGWHL